MSLLFNMLSRFVIAFLPKSKCLLISWLQSPSTVILEPRKIKSVTVAIVAPSICYEVMGLDAMILVFWMLSFKPVFSFSSFTFIKRLFSSSSLSARVSKGWCHLHIWGWLVFLPAILIPTCASSSQAFPMMHSAYKLNKQGDNIQPWRTPFPIWNQSLLSTKTCLRVLQRNRTNRNFYQYLFAYQYLLLVMFHNHVSQFPIISVSFYIPYVYKYMF